MVLRERLKDWFPEVYKRRNWSCYYTPDPGVLTMYEEDGKFRMYEVTKTSATNMEGRINNESFAEGTEFNGDGIPTATNGQDRCLIPRLVVTKEEESSTHESFEEYMGKIEDWERELMETTRRKKAD